MATALIIYGSDTGNTQAVAELIEETISSDYDVTLEDCADLGSNAFGDGYDIVFIGCSTWGVEPPEMQEDMEDFLDQIDEDEVDLSGTKYVVFGCGDDSYPHFAEAVVMMSERMEERGATNVHEAIRICDPWEDHEEEIKDWIAESLKKL
ncbi:MAG: flavodoxin family protein [Alphaproteobacteria bacterium]